MQDYHHTRANEDLAKDHFELIQDTRTKEREMHDLAMIAKTAKRSDSLWTRLRRWFIALLERFRSTSESDAGEEEYVTYPEIDLSNRQTEF